jgi:hypothetical protein
VSSRAKKGKVLARLKPGESASVLRSLLERHPDLVAEAEAMASAAVTEVDADAVAEDVEQAVLDLDIDDLGTRAGRKSWGYVEPTEAAWELLGEAVDPFLEEMKRHVELGFEAAAAGMCAGIVLGLYRCRRKNLRSGPRLGRGLPRGDRRSRGGDAGAREQHEAPSRLAAPRCHRRSDSGVGGHDRPRVEAGLKKALTGPGVPWELPGHGGTDAEPRWILPRGIPRPGQRGAHSSGWLVA